MAGCQKVLVVLGTRPEAIKLAPVIWALRARPERFKVEVLSTGQHREMLRPMVALLGIEPDVDLDLMQPGQTLGDVTTRCLTTVEALLRDRRPDSVIVQGDTTTAMAAALAAFYQRIPVGHVEAGLRSGSLDEPFPEEANRKIIDVFAQWLFAPTDGAAKKLKEENVADSRIFVTGNTVVDALQFVRKQLASESFAVSGLDKSVLSQRLVLVTCHRRESFGEGIASICRAIASLASSHPDTAFVYPVHMNPNVRGPVSELLGHHPNVHLIAPTDYDKFLGLLSRAHLVLTDSGGVQEEGPSFGVPVLVMRNRTERPEGVEAGCNRLVGNHEGRIVEEARRLLDDPSEHAKMSHATNPYGDGLAGERIAKILDKSSENQPPA